MSLEKKLITKDLKVRHLYPDNIHSAFSTNFLIQHQPEFFTVSFFDVDFPKFVNKSMVEVEKAMQHVDTVDAKCISKIVMTPETMRNFVTALNQNLGNYEMMVKMKEIHDEQKGEKK